jgi:phosphoribosylglycinamide formyltransferase 1
MKPLHLAILGSTRGSLLPPIRAAIQNNTLNAKIEVVASNQPDAGILAKAHSARLPNECVQATPSEPRADYDARLTQALSNYRIDVIVLIGFMRILSSGFVSQYRIINTHPSLLPRHAGLMDLAVHQSVLDAGDSESGCTVHEVSDVVDGGKILHQARCVVSPTDTAKTLKDKVQACEADALIQTLIQLSQEQTR